MSNVHSKYKNPDVLLADLGIENPDELDVNAIAMHCNVFVCYEDLIACEGRIIGNNNKAIISVNNKASLERQRFTVAHELGHWMFDRGTAFDCTEEMLVFQWGSHEKKAEVRANQYAADLLMPDFMFLSRAKNRSITIEVAKELARIFETSLTATSIRLVDAGSMPGLVACYKSGERVWFKRGPNIPRELWPNADLNQKSKSHGLIATGRLGEMIQDDTYADYWISHADAKKYDIHEEAIKVAKDTILVLLWWKNEQQLIDLDGSEPEETDWPDPHF